MIDREPIPHTTEPGDIGPALVRIQGGTGTMDDVIQVVNSPVTGEGLRALFNILFNEIDRLRAENEQLKVQVVFLRDELQQERESRNIPF